MDEPLLAGVPRDLPQASLTPPQQQVPQRSSKGPQRSWSMHDLRTAVDEVDESELSCWQKCHVAACCGPWPSKRRGIPAHGNNQAIDGGGIGGKQRAIHIPTDMDYNSLEASLLTQMAGGVWVTQVLSKVWPFIGDMAEKMIRDMFPGLVEANKPKWMEGITLDRVTLGTVVPIVRNVHVDQYADGHKNEVRLQLEVDWKSTSDIQLTVKPLPAMLNHMMPSLIKEVVEYVTSLTVGVQGLSIKAQLLWTLAPLIPTLPIIKTMQLSMMRAPDVDFNLTVTRGESRILNVLKPWLGSTIASAFAPFILPEYIFMPVADNAWDVQKPEGVLMVRVIKVENVPKMDYWGHSDTYVDVWVRGRLKRRTTVIKKEANPVWPPSEASFLFLIHTKRFQTLSFELWDEDNTVLVDTVDDIIGSCAVKLVDLAAGKEHELCLQVVNASTGDEKAQALDPAHAGGVSRVDVSKTKLHIAVRYLPASAAQLLLDEVGSPGTFDMKLTKVTVPDLALLPLKARPYITGQRPVTNPPLSASLYPLVGNDPVTGNDQSQRHDIPFSFDAIWDVLGSADQVASAVFVLEMVSGAGTKAETVAARVDVPLANVLRQKIPDADGAAGGNYRLRSNTGFEFDMQLLWSPLLSDDPASEVASTTPGAVSQVGLQSLLPHSCTSHNMEPSSDPGSAHGLQHSQSMSAQVVKALTSHTDKPNE